MGAFAFEEKLQKVRAVKDELAAKDRERQDLLQKVKDCEERMTKQRSKKSHYFSIKNEIHVRLEKLNQAKAAEEEKRDEANRELEGCLYKAQAICARIDVPTDETPEELLQKYHQYDQEYKQAMRQMGTTPEEISAMAEAADKTFKAVKRQVTDFSTTQQ
ncbi:Structural maintenance of chromosomes protein 6, partial [Ascosphaera atra]